MDSPPPPASLPLPVTARARHPWYSWRRVGRNYLTVSIFIHVLFGVGAAYLVVQRLDAKRKSFAAAPSANPAAHAIEHKVQLQKKQQTMSAPVAVKRVTTTGFSKVSLPTMPAMPSLDAAVAPVMMAGMGGTGLGGGAGGGGGGTGLTLFGLRGSSGGLEGTFYDYKMDQGYQPLKPFDDRTFAQMVHAMLPNGGAWHPDQPYQHFTSSAKLHGRYFMYPAIQDTGAGAAFQSPRSGPGHWLAVYQGSFSWPAGGSFRFVGFGDNVMIVQVGNHIVLDASDKGYTGLRREALGNIAFPGKKQTPLFAGEWLNLDAGGTRQIAIAVGDEGGIFCSGLFVQPQGTPYAQGEHGIPKLPVFMLGAPSEADRQLLGKYLPPEALQGPFFQAQAPRAAFDVFNR